MAADHGIIEQVWRPRSASTPRARPERAPRAFRRRSRTGLSPLLAVGRREWQSRRRSADVLQVQTSSRAGSEPKAMATWSGTRVRDDVGLPDTARGQQRGMPVGMGRLDQDAPIQIRGQRLKRLVRIVGRTHAGSRRRQSPGRRMLGVERDERTRPDPAFHRQRPDKHHVMSDRRSIEAVDAQPDPSPAQTPCDRRSRIGVAIRRASNRLPRNPGRQSRTGPIRRGPPRRP